MSRIGTGHGSVVAAADPDTPWTADPFLPSTVSIGALADAVQNCRGCPLYVGTTQAVFGEGSTEAPMMLVGEQPGDQEDVKGHPFVGPAGRVLWECLAEAGVDRDGVYVTNAVKHFKHEVRGARRLHKKPDTEEIEACHPWLDAELTAVRSRVIVALGATAARSLLGRAVPIAASRGATFETRGVPTIVTYHPSAVLRARDAARETRAALVADLRRADSLT